MKILLYDNGLPYDSNTPYNESLGGSETSLLLLAKGLSKNNSVVLLNPLTYKETISNNLIIDNNNLFLQYAELSDVIILNRSIPNDINNFNNIFYLCHDAWDQSNIRWMMDHNSAAVKNIKKIICVSNWQKNSFIKYLNVSPDNLIVLGNAIDPDIYLGSTKRNLNKLIFASIPFKGLEILLKLFSSIKFKSKNELLHLDIYSSFELYNRKEEDEQYKEIYLKLLNEKNINVFNPVSMKELSYKLNSSNMYLAPCTYHETFGRVFTESMSSGCIPIAVDNGANKEIIDNDDFIVNGKNIYNSDVFDMFVDKVCWYLDNPVKEEERDKMKNKTIEKWDYKKLSIDLEKIIFDSGSF